MKQDATAHERAETQMVEYGTRMRKERDRLQRVVDDAAIFLEARRSDGIDFPYDSRPMRKLREAQTR